MKSPNFFIVGGARCGTTALWDCLRRQPGVFMPRRRYKEPAYFSFKGKWRTLDQYMEIFRDVEDHHTWIGEASTAYLTDPDSAKNLYEFNPNSRIIIMLRNPVDRAYSLYSWMVQDGWEYCESFEKALELEDIRKNKKIPNYFEPEYYYNYQYFSSGLYFDQVKRYLDIFQDRVLIVKFEDFVERFEDSYHRICNFLGINPVISLDMNRNASERVKYAPQQFILRKLTQFYFKNRSNVEKLLDDETEFKKQFKEQVDYHFNQLDKVCKIGYVKKKLLKKKLLNLIDQIYSRDIILDNKTKKERDVLMRKGWLLQPTKPLDKSIAEKLKENYSANIKDLARLTGMDLDDWM